VKKNGKNTCAHASIPYLVAVERNDTTKQKNQNHKMQNTEKMKRLREIAQMMIDCTEKCDPPMPWMIEVTEDEFAKCAISQMTGLLDIANSVASATTEALPDEQVIA
jgi:hypothetical protein